MRKPRRRPSIQHGRAWTTAELEELATMSRVGLSAAFWTVALPSRTWSEIAAKRFELHRQGAIQLARTL